MEFHLRLDHVNLLSSHFLLKMKVEHVVKSNFLGALEGTKHVHLMSFFNDVYQHQQIEKICK